MEWKIQYIKMAILFNFMYKLSAIPIKIIEAFLKIGKWIQKLMWKCK